MAPPAARRPSVPLPAHFGRRPPPPAARLWDQGALQRLPGRWAAKVMVGVAAGGLLIDVCERYPSY